MSCPSEDWGLSLSRSGRATVLESKTLDPLLQWQTSTQLLQLTFSQSALDKAIFCQDRIIWLHTILNYSPVILIQDCHLRLDCQTRIHVPERDSQVEHFTPKQIWVQRTLLFNGTKRNKYFSVKTHKLIIYFKTEEGRFYRRQQLLNHSVVKSITASD